MLHSLFSWFSLTAPKSTIADEVSRRTRQQQALAELGQAALSGVDVAILVGQTCALVEYVLESTRCSIVERNRDGTFTLRFAAGGKSGFDKCGDEGERHQELYRRAIAHNRVMVSDDVDEDRRFDPSHFRRKHKVRAAAMVRIPGHHHPFGVLAVFSQKQRTFELDELEFLRAVADVAGSMIDSAHAREALATSEHRFRALIEHSSDGILMTDPAGTIRYASPSTVHILGFAEEELVGSRFQTMVHTSDAMSLDRMQEELQIRPGTPVTAELRVRNAEGEWRWIEAVSKNLIAYAAVGAIVINYRDITDRKESERQLERLAYRDSLTGLPNRFLFHDRVHHALEQARRRHRGLALMYVDLDRFKLVNDTLGHSIGDRLLEAVAGRLGISLRSGDTIARLGGDEFAILLPDLDYAEDAGVVARKILEALNQPFEIDGHCLYAPGSIGVSVFPDDGDDAPSLLKNADSALYRAKELGRNNIQLFTAAMNERYRHRLDIETTLRRAIDNGALEVHYQPIVDNETGLIRCFEALVRWQENGEWIAPSMFIPIAEETGLIRAIGDWVRHRVCHDFKEWRSRGIANFYVSVNLSAHEMRDTDIVTAVMMTLQQYGLHPNDLQFEVTESAALENLPAAMAVLGELRSLGVQIAVDDFGTGQSSLVYLKRLPLDTVKLDREFLRNSSDGSDLALLGSIIDLVHSLDLYVVAEGIETHDELQLLQALGCDGMQGFVFAAAMPPSEVPVFISSFTPKKKFA